MSAALVPCPRCGALNRDRAESCYLCEIPLREGPRVALAPPLPAGSGAVAGGAGTAGRDGEPAAVPEGPAAPGPPAGFSPGPAGGPAPGPALDMFEAAGRNARMTRLLFLLLFAVFFGLGGTIGWSLGSPGLGIALALILYAILASTAWFSGSAVLLSVHGAREADPEKDRRLRNVVEEMAVAAGMPPPRIYVMDAPGKNAFAAGRRPEEALIAVTAGLVEGLDRDEIQGVIAHEMAHIRSRDTVYNVCAAVLVGAIALLADAFLRGMPFRGRGRRPGSGRAGAAFLVLGVLFALLAPLAARLLRMSISRQREYHADAAAAALTRNPLALAAALEKIAGGAQVPGENRGTQHLFIVNPLHRAAADASALWSTHPPTALRIQRLKAMAGTCWKKVPDPTTEAVDAACRHDLRQGHLTLHDPGS